MRSWRAGVPSRVDFIGEFELFEEVLPEALPLTARPAVSPLKEWYGQDLGAFEHLA
jgi:hypothetical protein